MKKRQNKANDACVMFYDQAEEERYKRYKHVCYRNLVIKALLALVLGLLLRCLISLF